jgi:hypothetical protein
MPAITAIVKSTQTSRPNSARLTNVVAMIAAPTKAMAAAMTAWPLVMSSQAPVLPVTVASLATSVRPPMAMTVVSAAVMSVPTRAVSRSRTFPPTATTVWRTAPATMASPPNTVRLSTV